MATRSVTTLDKSDVLPGLFALCDAIDALLDALPEAQWQAATPLPAWDVRAVVAHIIGTESFLEGVSPPAPDVDVKEFEHVRNDIGAMNECWVRALSSDSGTSVLQRFRTVTGGRRA